MAFLDRPKIVVQIQRIIRTRLHARAAADASIPIDIHDPIGPLRKRIDRTNRHARRIRAMVAALNQKVALDIGELADFDVLDRCAEIPDRHLVLGFAGGRAGMAADAGVVVDDKAVLHAMGFYT